MNKVASIKSRLKSLAQAQGRSYQNLLQTYALERTIYHLSIIAEKLEIIISLGNLNSRYKDFFDIFVLAHTFSFSGELLQKAILQTFTQRDTAFQSLSAFEDSFVNDPIHQRRWKVFGQKKNVQTETTFLEVITSLKFFLLPIIQSIQENRLFTQTWNPLKQEWEN